MADSDDGRVIRQLDRCQAVCHPLSAVWAGGSDMAPPDLLDAAIIFAPVGALVP